ncbi:GNAT family N-acetyltransferase [Hymenobacter rubripertinctus]|uniref:GNAT family N-acetyltransferase n=1 Tax=Hymenobacter rubripertinctus TaxID=2029981 RepID=A0A418R055_9BACT|nr:GNAT family N-acetyltransferase [Hymenobacter rubripertinctus]RIY10781.1 GNAT family N-acetyltransferase [Hymenobacter rubripertinctus]
MPLTWTLKPFAELTTAELYALLQLRSEVFVVEQTCPFQDIDGLDQAAWHLLGHAPGGALAAYARLFGPGGAYPEASIGRVVSSPRHRRTGLGRELMRESLAAIGRLFGPQPIQIGAQLYLQTFYESFGFQQVGEGYLEDDIAHLHMVRA